jgi:pilus assembly protein CpaE
VAVKDFRIAAAIRQGLIMDGVPDESIWCVANRFGRRAAMVSLKQAQQSLSGARLERLRNDYRSAIKSFNFGQPLADTARRSPLRRDLCKLAEHVAGAGQGSSYAGETR